MKEASLGTVHVALSPERTIPLGQRHTAVGPLASGVPDLGLGAGANRQRWEQRSWSQGLDTAGWESLCITWGG